jgi:hypothetical protein
MYSLQTQANDILISQESTNTLNNEVLTDFHIPVEIDKSVRCAKGFDQRTTITLSDGKKKFDCHQSLLVCILCDHFIIGTESVHSITPNRLKKHQHSNGVESNDEYYNVILRQELINQYSIEGLSGLLLSLRARQTNNSFDLCKNCNNAMRHGLRRQNMQLRMVL